MLIATALFQAAAIVCNAASVEELHDGWQICAAKAGAAKDTSPPVMSNSADWYPATVPSTVTGTLVKDAKYKAVFIGDNLKQISSEPFDHPWWYCNRFKLPKSDQKTVLLEFDGINYRANIWLNGKQIANSETAQGPFRRFSFDITDVARFGDQENELSVEVFPPNKTGPSPEFWDWNPPAPDHNTGLFREVRVRTAGDVALAKPQVRTKLDVPSLSNARLTVATDLTNHADRKVHGQLVAQIGDIKLTKPIDLEKRETKRITLSPEEFAQLTIEHPRVWWTRDLGKPELYELKLAFETDAGTSDETSVRFGIHDVASYFTPEGARGFKLNGMPILVRGGGWADDIFLNYDPAKLKAQIDYVRHMNLNALRMEGFFGNNDDIYNLCDENGILLLVGWMCGWEYAHYDGRDAAQREQLAALWTDQVTWLRNHPSIFCWLYGSDLLTRPETEQAYLKVFSELDPDRPVCSSAAEVNSKVTGKSGVHMGPYDWNTPRWWYESAKGFDTETGPGIQVPPIEAFKAIMPEEKLWPPNATWNLHASRNKGDGFGTVASHLKAIKQHAGEATNLDDFWRKSELLSYESVRAMYEGWRGKAPQTTGVIMWMLNSAWPKLEWQLYDYSLAPCSCVLCHAAGERAAAHSIRSRGEQRAGRERDDRAGRKSDGEDPLIQFGFGAEVRARFCRARRDRRTDESNGAAVGRRTQSGLFSATAVTRSG